MDLKTTYLGLELENPLVPSASPLSHDVANVKRMEDAGAPAVVLFSLFEEQLELEAMELEHHLEYGSESFPEALTYFPATQHFAVGPEGYLEHVRRLKEAVGVPVIASLNGSTLGGWTEYARMLEQAGADGLELNIYWIPTSFEQTGAEVEQIYLDILQAVRREVKIPVAVKLGPFFSNFANLAHRLDGAGADGLVLFNRFYQPDIDLEELEVKPNVLLSTPQDLRLPMRWIAILWGRVKASLAATSGVHTGEDATKLLMAGASVTMLCSALLEHGIGHLRQVRLELERWMEDHEYESVRQMQGSMSQLHCPNPTAFERAQYMRAIKSYAHY
jgi:dihydroorotate dehydrogenase (fumarate)